MNSLDIIAQPGKMTLGLVFPIEGYKGSVATMQDQEKLAQQAEALGFKALWFRDVPLNDPSFGDAGQLYDPWVYMTHIMNHTESIVLATGSVILPLRHPIHTAKSFLSLQHLSDGRIVLGVASGDRPIEYPAFNRDIRLKSELFRDSFQYIKALQGDFPVHESEYYGKTFGNTDLLPKFHSKTAMLVTGRSGQTLDWIAQHSDGWIYYPRDFSFLQRSMTDWNAALAAAGHTWKPYVQSLYVDLLDDINAHPRNIHLGFSSGTAYLLKHLETLQSFGVNHVIINLKYSSRPVQSVLDDFGEAILPKLVSSS